MLRINQNTKVLSDVDYDTANYVCDKLSDLKKYIEVLDVNKLSLSIKSAINTFPLYVWKLDYVHDKSESDAFGKEILKHRKYNDISNEKFKKISPITYSYSDYMFMLLRYDDYFELYIQTFKDTKTYICLANHKI